MSRAAADGYISDGPFYFKCLVFLTNPVLGTRDRYPGRDMDGWTEIERQTDRWKVKSQGLP